jgi:hypothetical protein
MLKLENMTYSRRLRYEIHSQASLCLARLESRNQCTILATIIQGGTSSLNWKCLPHFEGIIHYGFQQVFNVGAMLRECGECSGQTEGDNGVYAVVDA